MERGIYLEAKKVMNTKYRHLYLVYRDGQGHERAIRGGAHENLSYSDFPTNLAKPMEIEADIRLADSEDARNSDDADSRPSRKLDIPPERVSEVWSDMVRTARDLATWKLEYDLHSQNSNSFINAVLKNLGIDVRRNLPPGVTKDLLLGVDNDLTHPRQVGDFWRRDEPSVSFPMPPRHGRVSETPSRSLEPAHSRAGSDKASSLSPAARKYFDRLVDLGDAPAEIMRRPLHNVTEAEIKRLTAHHDYWTSAMSGKPHGPTSMPDFVSRWYQHAYNRSGSATPFGSPVSSARVRPSASIAKGLAQVFNFLGRAAENGVTAPVKALQRTINAVVGDSLMPQLKVDGVLGPKTNYRLRTILVDGGLSPLLTGLERAVAKD